LTLGALELALSKSTPEIHHSDQGLQYAATDYTARLQSVGAQISMAEVGQSAPQRLCRASHPNDQGRRSLPERPIAILADAREQIGRFIDDVYLSKRIHSLLGYLTPAEFEAQWRAQQKAAAIPRKKS